MTYNIRAATIDDAATIAPLLREADKNEVRALSDWTPKEAIEYSISHSDEAWFVSCPDSHPILITGIGEGVPWMLATPMVKRYGKSLIKEGRKLVDRWTKRYGYLCNYVDARNETHVDWLIAMGFIVYTAEFCYIGRDSEVPFHYFNRRETRCA